jgi:hypothetical protein
MFISNVTKYSCLDVKDMERSSNEIYEISRRIVFWQDNTLDNTNVIIRYKYVKHGKENDLYFKCKINIPQLKGFVFMESQSVGLNKIDHDFVCKYFIRNAFVRDDFHPDFTQDEILTYVQDLVIGMDDFYFKYSVRLKNCFCSKLN